MEPSIYVGLVIQRDANAANNIRVVRTYEIYLDSSKPRDTFRYEAGELDVALIWGTSAKQVRSFAAYLFGRGDLAVAQKPLRHDPTLALFSSLPAGSQKSSPFSKRSSKSFSALRFSDS